MYVHVVSDDRGDLREMYMRMCSGFAKTYNKSHTPPTSPTALLPQYPTLLQHSSLTHCSHKSNTPSSSALSSTNPTFLQLTAVVGDSLYVHAGFTKTQIDGALAKPAPGSTAFHYLIRVADVDPTLEGLERSLTFVARNTVKMWKQKVADARTVLAKTGVSQDQINEWTCAETAKAALAKAQATLATAQAKLAKAKTSKDQCSIKLHAAQVEVDAKKSSVRLHHQTSPSAEFLELFKLEAELNDYLQKEKLVIQQLSKMYWERELWTPYEDGTFEVSCEDVNKFLMALNK